MLIESARLEPPGEDREEFLVGAAQPAHHRVDQLFQHAVTQFRVGIEKGQQTVSRQFREFAIGHRHHRGGAVAAVEQRQLAEHLAVAEIAHAGMDVATLFQLQVGEDADRALQDQIDGVGVVAFAENEFIGGVAAAGAGRGLL